MTPAPRFLAAPPRFLFFTGKGGVGKTSVACATAIRLAEAGREVLLVSTDPASNVGQVLGLTIGHTITAIPAVPGLSALEIDPEEAAEVYRQRIIEPVRDLLPAAEISAITEELSGSCTTEIASFNEFTALLTDHASYGKYDHIVFDTAPTGHTIRLLQLPGSWTDFLQAGRGDASCLGPLSGLEKQRAVYADAVAALQDPGRTRMVLVTRAQSSSLSEAERTRRELAQIGIMDQYLVVNGVLPARADSELIGRSIRDRETKLLTDLPEGLGELARDTLELKSGNMVGIGALKSLFTSAEDFAPVTEITTAEGISPTQDLETKSPGFDSDHPNTALADLIDELAIQDHGLVMCLGKGGVGKTTIAAAIATDLARRGYGVRLTTTDPAAHLENTLPQEVPGLLVSSIDPVLATQAYRDHVMATKGKNLDDAGRATLAEDLRSPCTEEVAVFQQFAQAVNESRRHFVVIDTAPTGHTLLLLDAAGSYHREVARQLTDSMSFTTPLMRLQDPKQTKVIIVTLAEPTPVQEARQLQDDLRRADIQPWAWVINNSLAAAHPSNHFLKQRAAAELEQIAAVHDLADRLAIVPLLAEEPVGERRLAEVAGTGHP